MDEGRTGVPESSINGKAEQSHVVQLQPEQHKVRTISHWLKRLEVQHDDHRLKPTQGNTQIRRVPHLLRGNIGCRYHYLPKVVSLGPYHFGSDGVKGFQKLKASMADEFLADKALDKESGQFLEDKKKLEHSLRSEIHENIGKLKAAYPQEEYKGLVSDEDWVNMLFLDGCFVLNFILCIMFDRVEDLKIERYEIRWVHNDLFLQENQLPYLLLKILSGDDPKLLRLVRYYICMCKLNIDLISWVLMEEEEPVHLLDCLRTIFIGRPCGAGKCNRLHLLAGLFSKAWERCFPGNQKPWSPSDERMGPELGSGLLNAKELTTRGIHFKPNRTGFLKEIFFRSHFFYGTLRLPRIVVNDWTGPLLLNLAAYEMSADKELTVASYICFLDSLVDHADDIKELQSAGVLVNHLATDEKAANLFNDMSQGIVPDSDEYTDVKRKIHNFFRNKAKANLACWIAEGYHNHFKSPLKAMAVFAATLVLALTITQTYFTIYMRGN